MLKRFLLKNLQLKDINPRVCGIHNCQPGEVLPRHHIKRQVLHYVTKGRGRYLANDRDYTIGAGDIFVCHPGYVTSYLADEDDPMTYIWVSFDCNDSFAALIALDVFSAPWSQNIFEKILDCSSAAAAEWAICARLYDFFVLLAQRQAPSEPPQDDYVSRALNFIQTNYADGIQIADMAADLGLSRNYFCRIFKQKTSLSPQAYLVTYRLDMAAKLLVEEGLSQKEAALQVGYPDVCAFSRMFRRKYGVSPGAYVKDRLK